MEYLTSAVSSTTCAGAVYNKYLMAKFPQMDRFGSIVERGVRSLILDVVERLIKASQ